MSRGRAALLATWGALAAVCTVASPALAQSIWEFEDIHQGDLVPGCVSGMTLAGFEIDPAGRPVVAWREENGCGGTPRVFWSRRENVQWSTTEYLSPNRYQGGAQGDYAHQLVLRPSDGNPFFVYADVGGGNAINTYRADLGAYPDGAVADLLEPLVGPQNCAYVRYSLAFAPAGQLPQWATGLSLCNGYGPIRIDGGDVADTAVSGAIPALAVTSDGTRHLLWNSGSNLYYTRWPAGVSGAAPVPTPLFTNISRFGGEVRLVAQGAVLHALLRGQEIEADWDPGVLVYFRSDDGGQSWTAPEYVDPYDAVPNRIGIHTHVSLAVDASGIPAVTYWKSNQELWYARRDGPSGTWTQSRITSLSYNNQPRDNQLRFEADGTPVVAFYDSAANSLRLARPLPAGVTPVVDVAVSTEFSPAQVSAGGPSTLTLTVRNLSDVNVSDVVLRHELSPGLTLGAPSPAPGADTTWHIGLLTSGAAYRVTIPVTAPAAGDFVDVARASVVGDADSSNDIAVAGLSVGEPAPSGSTPDVQVTLYATPSLAQLGAVVGFVAKVTNVGSGTVDNVPLTLTAPDELSLTEMAPAPAGGSPHAPAFALGPLSPGQSAWVLARAQLPGAYGTFTLHAALAVPGDTNAANDEADATVRVAPNACFVAPGGLVGRWRAEGAGVDDVGGRTAALHGGIGFAAGHLGQAFSLDGATAYAQVEDDPALRPAQFTVAAWVYPTKFDSGWDTVVAKGSSGTDPALPSWADSYWLGFNDGYPVVYTQHQPSLAATTKGPSRLRTGEWYHLAASFDGATVRLYVNGAEVASTAEPQPLAYDRAAVPLLFGADWEAGPSVAQGFDGLVDEITLHDRALSAGEVMAMVDGAPATCLPSDSADMQVTASVTPTFTAPNGVVTYTITALNPSPGYVTGVEVTHTPPDGVSVIDSSVAPSSTVGRTQSFLIGALPAGGSYPIVIRATAPTTPGLALTQAAVRSDVPDPDASNNAATVSLAVAPDACFVPPDGLAGRWHGDGDARDEVSGSVGTPVGTVDYATGRVGEAFSLGAAGYVQIPDSAALRPAQFTVAAWVYPTMFDSGWNTVVSKGSSGADPALPSWADSYWIGFRNGGVPILYTHHAGNVEGQTPGPSPLAPGQWYHLAAAFDGATTRLYVDGVQVAENPINRALAYDVNDVPLLIGNDWTGGAADTVPFHGLIDEVTLHDRALSPAEVAALVDGSPATCVIPSNAAPVLVNPGDQTSAEGDTVSLQVGASDPDGDTLSFEAAGLPAGLGIDATTGVISGIPSFDSAGSHAVTVSVSDGTLSDAVTFTWNVTDTNRPPEAADDTVQWGSGFDIDVLANDVDPDGDPLTLDAIVTPPQFGQATIQTGRIRYAPQLPASAFDSFVYRVSDGRGGAATATVQIVTPAEASADVRVTLERVQPSLSGLPEFRATITNAGLATALNVQANAFASTGGMLYGVSDAPAGVWCSGEWSCILRDMAPGASVTLSFTAYVPTPDWSPGTFDVTVFAASADGTPDPEVSNNVARTTVEVRQAAADLDLSLSASPTEYTTGDTVEFTATIRNDGPERSGYLDLEADLDGVPAEGAVPPDNCAVSGSRHWTCYPPPLDPGSVWQARFLQRSVDAGTRASSARVDFAPIARPFMSDPDLTNNVAALTTIARPPNHPPTIVGDVVTQSAEGDQIDFVLTATDPDGDPLALAEVTLPHGVGASLNGSVLRVSGALAFDAAGEQQARIVVQDPRGLTASRAWTWTVTNTNRPPVVDATSAQLWPVGEPVDLTLAASDPDGDRVTWTVTGLPPGLVVDPDGRITGTPLVPDFGTATARAFDGTAEATFEFAWTAYSRYTRDLAVRLQGPANYTGSVPVTVPYRLEVHNVGEYAFDSFVVRLAVGAPGLVTEVPNGCAPLGLHDLRCSGTALEPGTSQSFDLVVSGSGRGSSTLALTARLEDASPPDDNAANDLARLVTSVTAVAPDLAVSIQAPSSVSPGAAFDVSIDVSNVSTDPIAVASRAQLGVQLGPNLAPVFALGCAEDNRRISCELDAPLAPGDERRWTLTLRAGPNARSSGLDGTAFTTISADVAVAADPDVSNNTASVELDVSGPTVRQMADLAVSLTVPDSVAVPDDLTGSVTVRNLGPEAIDAYAVTVALGGSGLEYVELDQASGCQAERSSQWQMTALGQWQQGEALTGPVRCSGGALGPGQAREFAIRFATTRRFFDTRIHEATASVRASVDTSARGFRFFADPDLGNNAAESEVLVREPSADLSVSAVGPALVAPWGTAEFHVTLTNNGPDTTTGAMVAASFDDRDLYGVSTEDCATESYSIPFNVTLSQYECRVPEPLAPGESVELTARFRVARAVPSIAVLFRSRSDGEDPDPSNDTASVVTPIEQRADLSVAVTGPGHLPPGRLAGYRIRAANGGTGEAQDATLRIKVSGGEIVWRPSTCRGAEGGVECPLGTLAANASTDVAVSVRPTIELGTLHVVASASTPSTELNLGNNVDSLAVSVFARRPRADLQVTAEVIGDATPSPEVRFRLRNNGPTDAQVVRFRYRYALDPSAFLGSIGFSTDLIPPSVSWMPAAIWDGVSCSRQPLPHAIEAVWDCTTRLAVGESRIVSFVASAAESAEGSIRLGIRDAEFDGVALLDPVRANNGAAATVHVAQP